VQVLDQQVAAHRRIAEQRLDALARVGLHLTPLALADRATERNRLHRSECTAVAYRRR